MSRDIVANLKFRQDTSDGGGFTAEKLAQAIERGYMKQVREDKFTTKKTFAPSSIGYGHGTCARYWYQAFNGVDFKEKTDALGIANMSNGSAAHERLEKVLEDAEVLVAKEIKMELKDPPIFGYIDVLVKIDGETVVGELKTTRQEAFLFRQNSMKPSGNHLYQILIYMKATGKKKGFMFYENKNDQTYLVIPVEMTPKNEAILEEALDWLRLVRKTWELGEGTNSHLPTRPWTKRNKNCRGCPLFEQCWENDNAEVGTVTIAPMEVVKP